MSALDASVQAQILEPAARRAGTLCPGLSSFISHDLSVVGFLCRRIVVYVSGAGGGRSLSGAAFFRRGASLHAGGLMAAMPTGEGGGYLAPPLEGELPSPLDPPDGCRFHPVVRRRRIFAAVRLRSGRSAPRIGGHAAGLPDTHRAGRSKRGLKKPFFLFFHRMKTSAFRYAESRRYFFLRRIGHGL